MKKKPISLLITVTLLLSTIGGAIGYNSYIWSLDYSHGSCHDDPNLPGSHGYQYGNVSVTSAWGNITITDVDPDTITVGMEFTIAFQILNFTEVLEYPYGNANYDVNTVGRDNSTMVGISEEMADNTHFMQDLHNRPIFHGVSLNSTGGASSTGGYSDSPLELTLRAPFAPGTYELEIVAVNGLNKSALDGESEVDGFIICLGSVEIIVFSKAPVGTLSVASSDDDDDDDAEGAISGYILIITLAAIFSVSAVLIITMKKRMKNKSRNV